MRPKYSEHVYTFEPSVHSRYCAFPIFLFVTVSLFPCPSVLLIGSNTMRPENSEHVYTSEP